MNKHPTAIIESNDIGIGTSFGPNAHIWPETKIGSNCQISEGVVIRPNATIGDNVVIGSGVVIGSRVLVEDNVTIGERSVFVEDTTTKDLYTYVRAGSKVGANSTILQGITIGHKANVSAGSVVSQNVPQNAIIVGNPAQIAGYVNSPRHSVTAVTKLEVSSGEVYSSRVYGVSVIRLPTVPDLRGSLTFGEFENHIPFPTKRFFFIYDVPSKELRGEHSHRYNHQFLICIHGSVNALVDNGKEREEFVLDSPNIGLHIPPMIWGTQYKYSEGAILLVFASHLYEAKDYIRDYQEFLSYVNK